MKLSTPFQHLMPSLPLDVFASLKADIAANGLRCPIVVDEDGNILDGHHRYRACGEIGIEPMVIVERNLADDDEKRLRIWAINLNQRRLTPAQTKHLRRKQKQAAIGLLQAGRGVREVARITGCPVMTVSDWAKGGVRPVRQEQGTEMIEVGSEKSSSSAETAPASRAEKKSALIDLVRNGAPVAVAARSLAIPESTAQQWVAKPEVPARSAQPRARKREIEPQVEQLAEQGLGTNAIADRLGVPRGAVTEAKKRLGIGKAAARARNPLLNITQRAETDAAVWRNVADMALAAARTASPMQVGQLITELDRLATSVAQLKSRLKKEAAKGEMNGQEVREARC